MTNTDQSNHAATSPTNSEAVRSGEWLGDEALKELRKPDAAGRWECRHELSAGWDGVDVRHIDPPDVPLVRYADRWHDAEWMIVNGWVAWRRAVNASSPNDQTERTDTAGGAS